MKIETIYCLERKNLGNYEHIEMSATARLEDGESFTDAMTSLKNTLHSVLHGVLIETPTKEVETPVTYDEETKINLPVAEVKAKKEKKKKAEVAPDPLTPEVIEEAPKPKASKLTPYDSNVAELKAIFSGYLAKSYGTSWTTVAPKEEIKAFTASLNGKDFLNDQGQIAPMFLEEVHTFFGMPQ